MHATSWADRSLQHETPRLQPTNSFFRIYWGLDWRDIFVHEIAPGMVHLFHHICTEYTSWFGVFASCEPVQ